MECEWTMKEEGIFQIYGIGLFVDIRFGNVCCFLMSIDFFFLVSNVVPNHSGFHIE